jgi:hypothetical protein
MSLRIFSFGVLLAATACGPTAENKVATAAPDDLIECATGGGPDFTRSCAIERGSGSPFILRHADGGFRRIDLAGDGTITALDGSDEARGEPLPDGRFELILGRDRYRLPPRR